MTIGDLEDLGKVADSLMKAADMLRVFIDNQIKEAQKEAENG